MSFLRNMRNFIVLQIKPLDIRWGILSFLISNEMKLISFRNPANCKEEITVKMMTPHKIATKGLATMKLKLYQVFKWMFRIKKAERCTKNLGKWNEDILSRHVCIQFIQKITDNYINKKINKRNLKLFFCLDSQKRGISTGAWQVKRWVDLIDGFSVAKFRHSTIESLFH